MKPHFPGANASLDPHKNSDKTELLWINHLIPYKVLKKPPFNPSAGVTSKGHFNFMTKYHLAFLKSGGAAPQLPSLLSRNNLSTSISSPFTLHSTTEKNLLASTQMFPEYFPTLKLHYKEENHDQWAKTSVDTNTPCVKNDKKNKPLFLDKKENR